MGTSAFQLLQFVDFESYVALADILPEDLVFSKNTPTNSKLGTPFEVMREIEVQFITPVSGILTVSHGGDLFRPINNGDDILGLATFTLFVDFNSILQFQFSNNADNLQMWVGA